MSATVMKPGVILAAAVLSVLCGCTAVRALEPEDYEEPAGGSFSVYVNPADDVYGISLNSGVWLKGTPVFGDLFLGLQSSQLEDAFYSNFGMTLRLMPHWQLAPFVGAGGGYAYAWSKIEETPEEDPTPADEDLTDRGESHWSGHVEGGLRLWLPNRWQLFELSGRYNWTSLGGDRDYWLVGISTGTGI